MAASSSSNPAFQELEQLVALDTAEAPLAVLWQRCFSVFSQHEQVAASASRSDESAALLRACIALLATTEARVDAQGIFSSNETGEDLTTGSMKYMLIPYYAAELLTASPAKGPQQRAGAVRDASNAYGRFIARAEQYELLGELGKNVHLALERMGGALDPGTKRTMKLDKFKREKAITAQIQELQSRRGAAAAKEQDGVEASSSSGAAGASSGQGQQGSLDEEEERQLWSLTIEMACLKALEQRSMLQQEMELLEHAARAASGRGPSEEEGASSSRALAASKGSGSQQQQQQQQGPKGPVTPEERAFMMAALRGVVADLGAAKRDQIKSEVFRPSHLPPTMTLDEYAAMEVEDARRREAAEKRAADKEAARRAAMSADEIDDEEKKQARDWDDYRDANPRGAGNSKLRPCG